VRIQVEFPMGRNAGRPLRFVLGEQTIEVQDLLDRWYGEQVDYFRVRDQDGHLYVIKHLRAQDRWELTSFTCRGSRGTTVESRGPGILH
jgi:hypothetical protein